MTALPPDVSWTPPAPGAFTRQFRLGEWIGEPVTPLFESWLLSAMEERMHAWFFEQIGQRAPRPHHVVVNGWYFYSLNWIGPGGHPARACRGCSGTWRDTHGAWRASTRRPCGTASRLSSGSGARTSGRGIAPRSATPRPGSRRCQ